MPEKTHSQSKKEKDTPAAQTKKTQKTTSPKTSKTAAKPAKTPKPAQKKSVQKPVQEKLLPKEKPVVQEKQKEEPQPETTQTPSPKGTLLSRLAEAKKQTKQRKFTQSWDISINLKGMDLKKPENRFNTQLTLPGGRGKEVKVAVIADSLANEAQQAGADMVIRKNEIGPLGKNKKKLKKIANDMDWFFGEVTLMAEIGKQFGTVLGPRGKMPRPVPPKVKIEPLIKSVKKSVRIVVKESPVVHVIVGTEKLSDQDVVKNIEAVINLVKDKLPKGGNNIRSIFLKLTMGKPVKLDVK